VIRQNLGQIITFYSYKGGVGRTMALVNIAVLLARQGNRVLTIDWDLEAPGLERYFEPYLDKTDNKGLIDFLIKANVLPSMEEDDEDETLLKKFYSGLDEYIIPVSKLPNISGSIQFLRAGNTNEVDYTDKILSFDWPGFFRKIPGFFTHFAYYLKEHYDYVLIDSRTGHTDAGGVCTMLLPDSLVLVFIPNNQNLSGVLALAESASNYRKNSGDVRPIRIFPLPSRIELQEKEKREDWHKKYTHAFENIFKNIYNLPDISMVRYFENFIRQDTFFAYGEEIAVVAEKTKTDLSLTTAYANFLEKILSAKKIWDLKKPIKDKERANVKVVQIYAPADKHLKDKLDLFFKPVKSKTKFWRDILLQSDLDENDLKQIIIQMEGADILILLLSADFLATGSSNLLEGTLDRMPNKNKFAVILRPCLWDIFINSDNFHIFSKNKPISQLSDTEQEEVFNEIAESISRLITPHKNHKL